jgi:outer membrane receptor for ferrienterochelin and colicin
MLRKTKLNRIAIAVAMSVGMSTAVMAQETSSAINGTVFDTSGNTVSGANVTLFDTRTGATKELVSGSNGVFNTKGLRIGGPYILTVKGAAGSRIVENVYLTLGEPLNIDIALESSSNVETITVTGVSGGVLTETKGPSSNFNFDDLQNQPSVNRDIKDTIAIDPRISIDPTNADAITCGGANNRFNSITVDGIRQNDNFGLNANGYPTERLPFPFDAIDQVAVELAPFDVQYGGFTGCNINAVIRSGTNEVHGSVFYDYTSDSLQGDSINGDNIDVPEYDEVRYGFTIGAPLIKDKLFIFAAFEKHEPTEIHEFGPEGAGFANPISGLTIADVENIANVAQSLYGYQVGPVATSSDEREEKVLIKLDWQINSDHRSSLTYQNTDGNTVSETDSNSRGFAFKDHFYERANELTTYSLQVFSDWSADFVTEAKLGYAKVTNGQKPFTTEPSFGEFRIDNVGTGERTIHFGADQFRQANELEYETTSMKLAGTYFMDDHELSGGFEYEEVEVFNLFVPGSQGLFTFDSVADFEAGIADNIDYNIPGSLNPVDGVAEFAFQNTTLYVQDKWTVNDELTLTLGLRYDKWTSDSTPVANSSFEQRYGFTNAVKPDMDLLQPRVGFNYTYDDSTFVYGGVGLFAGGNPNVWLSNNFSNDGTRILASSAEAGSGNPLEEAALNAANTPNFGLEVPDYLVDTLAGGDGAVNALDSDFDVPAIWKYNLGVQKEFGDGWLTGADIIYTKQKDAARTIPLNTELAGTAPDGRPIYRDIDILNPSGGRRTTDYFLTNANQDGESTVISFFGNKAWDNGIRASMAYAYTEADEGSPMNSSTASSNFGNLSVVDLNNPGIATSNYEIKHRFTANFSYNTELFDGLKTRFNLFAQRVSGRPYSINFDRDPGFGDERGFEDRNLLYVPTEGDALVEYADGFDLAAFNTFIDENGLTRGQITSRNSQNSDWWTRVDFRFSQEFPGFMEDHRGEFTFTIRNLGNLLNDEWGVYQQVNFEYNNPVVDATIQDNGTYLYTNFDGDQGQSIRQDASLWSMRVGVKYTF